MYHFVGEEPPSTETLSLQTRGRLRTIGAMLGLESAATIPDLSQR